MAVDVDAITNRTIIYDDEMVDNLNIMAELGCLETDRNFKC